MTVKHNTEGAEGVHGSRLQLECVLELLTRRWNALRSQCDRQILADRVGELCRSDVSLISGESLVSPHQRRREISKEVPSDRRLRALCECRGECGACCVARVVNLRRFGHLNSFPVSNTSLETVVGVELRESLRRSQNRACWSARLSDVTDTSFCVTPKSVEQLPDLSLIVVVRFGFEAVSAVCEFFRECLPCSG